MALHPRSRRQWGTTVNVRQEQRVRCACEPLEQRLILSFTFSGLPGWNPEGPAPIVNAQVVGMAGQRSNATGAVEALLTHPTNADIVYAGSVNGGIWKTTNATVANDGMGSPTWIPLTDQESSLTISSMAFDPADPTFNTIWAAHGHFSSLNSG